MKHAPAMLASTLSKRRGSDFAAVAVLFTLYALLPAIVAGMKIDGASLLFFPRASDPAWLSPAVAWSESAIAAILAIGRLALPENENKAVTAQ